MGRGHNSSRTDEKLVEDVDGLTKMHCGGGGRQAPVMCVSTVRIVLNHRLDCSLSCGNPGLRFAFLFLRSLHFFLSFFLFSLSVCEKPQVREGGLPWAKWRAIARWMDLTLVCTVDLPIRCIRITYAYVLVPCRELRVVPLPLKIFGTSVTLTPASVHAGEGRHRWRGGQLGDDGGYE